MDESAKALAEGRRRGAPSADMLGLLALLHIDCLIDVGRWPEAQQQCIREVMVVHADSLVTNSLDMRCALDVR